MYRNDAIGDCAIAAPGHMIQTWGAAGRKQCMGPSEEEIIAAYSAITGYDEKDPATDQGTVELDVLRYWQKTGIGGHSIGAYVAVEPTSTMLVKDGVYLFGGLYIGLALPVSAQRQDVWEVPPGGATGAGRPGSWGGHCFTGDTKISMLDGTEQSLASLAETHRDKEFWVYSCDPEGNVVPGRATLPRKTGEKRPIVIVRLDNDQEVRCTPDHRFLLRNGTYREASKLQAGDSLMPLYRRTSAGKDLGGYEQFYNPKSKRWYFTHRMVAWSLCGSYEGVVHHLDFNKLNNDPENLTIMSWSDHMRLHAGRADSCDGLARYARSEAGRAKSRELMLRNWSDPAFRERALARAADNGRRVMTERAAVGQCGTQTWDKDKLIVHGRALGLKYAHLASTPEANAKKSASLRTRFANDPELRAARALAAAKNIRKAHGLPRTAAQLVAVRQNALRTAYKSHYSNDPRTPTFESWMACRHILSAEARRRHALKSSYVRYHSCKPEFPTFDSWLQSRDIALDPNNHEVVSVRDGGCEDVYDITVDRHHNFALTAGVFVHNSVNVVDYNPRGLTVVTWGAKKRMSWGFLKRYCEEAYAIISEDFFADGKAPNGFDLVTLQADLAALRA